MKIAAEWLNQYLERKLSTPELTAALELAGVEVEGVIEAIKLDHQIVVGRVAELKQHPNADKLRIAQIDVQTATLQIVCGAPNIQEGQKVVVALEGAKLPDGTVIRAAKLRGADSHGMICSESELGLSQNHDGILVLSETTEAGSPAAALLSGSDVIDTTTAANRWDLNSVIGLAREVAAHSDQRITLVPPEYPASSQGAVMAHDSSPDQVARYMLAHLEVDAGRPTPSWVQQRLQAGGIRSINLVVDITNYVMLEYGQPLHAFDATKLTPPIEVRLALAGETAVTLDGLTRKLTATDLLITDTVGPIGLAGVMGCRNAEIDVTSTAIYLEAASFHGPTLRRTAQRLGLRTDASARFERGLPVDLAPLALARAIQLLIEHASAKLIAAPADLQTTQAAATAIAIDPQRISTLLGLEVAASRITTELAKLEFRVAATTPGLVVTPPWWRPDIRQEADVAEEIIKLIGYDALPATLPAWAPNQITFDRRWSALWQAKAVLCGLGLFEVATYSFISQAQINALGRDSHHHLKLKNPLSIEQAYLRTDLLPSLLRVAERNRAYSRRFGVFEVSKVYHPQAAGELPDEPTRLGVLMRAEQGSYQVVKAALDRIMTAFAIAVTLEVGVPEEGVAHPRRAARIWLGEREIGWLGQLHPGVVDATKLEGEVAYLELDWQAVVAAARPRRYDQPSRFPASRRDLSILVDRSVSWQAIATALTDYEVHFLSDYYGDDLPTGKKAVALRLRLSDPQRTLTEVDVESRTQAVITLLEQRFDAALRG